MKQSGLVSYALFSASVLLALGFATGCELEGQPGFDTGTDGAAGADGGAGSDGGVTTPDCNSFTDLSGSIEEDRTLSGDCFLASSGLTVGGGATLTVEPGTVIAFEENTGLTVEGKMKAVGASGSPIVFTGSTKMPGWWNGVRFDNSESSLNQLEHVVIEYGGGDGNSKGNLNLSTCCGNGTTLSVKKTTLRHGAGYGFAADGGGHFTEFSGNTVTKNAKGAGWINASHVNELDGATSYTGNEKDVIRVTGGTEPEEVEWATLDVPLLVDKTVTVGDSGFVTIAKDNTLRFDENQAFQVEGRLTVSGAEGAEVTFTGTREEAGWWAGIEFNNTDSTDNVVEYAIVKYGGSKDDANLRAKTCCGNSNRLAVRNTTLTNSAGYGFIAGGGTQLEAFENNELRDNKQGAAGVHARIPGSFAASNSFKGNQTDVIFVEGTVGSDATWQAFEVPYRAEDGLTVGDGTNLTIKPGATFTFAENKGFTVEGTLTAEGTSSDKIEFRGVESKKGHWKSLRFDNTDSQDNILKHVVVSDAGGDGKANLSFTTCCGNQTTASVDDVTLKNGENAGVYADGGSRLRGCSNVTIMNCASEANYKGTSKSFGKFKGDACK